MRPIYLFISYLTHKQNNGTGEFTYGGFLHKFDTPATTDEIREIISTGLGEKFGVVLNPGDIQIMGITPLKKRVYNMLKGIR